MNLFRISYESIPENSSKKVLSLILRFKDAGLLTAEGFFDVNKGLIVAITSTLVTYIIILLQMQVSDG